MLCEITITDAAATDLQVFNEYTVGHHSQRWWHGAEMPVGGAVTCLETLGFNVSVGFIGSIGDSFSFVHLF